MYVWFAPTMTSLVSEYLPCGFRSDLPTNDSSLGHCGLVRAQGCWARTTDPAGALVSEGPGLLWGLPQQRGNTECSSTRGTCRNFLVQICPQTFVTHPDFQMIIHVLLTGGNADKSFLKVGNIY